jgi:capsular exopolysaccharide synthesis family protein
VPLLLIFLALFLLLGAGAMSVKTSFRARSLLAIGETESLATLRDDRFGRRQRPSTASASLSGKTYATIAEGLPMAQTISVRFEADSINVTPEFIHRAVRAEFYEPEVLEISATAKESDHAIQIANAAAMAFIDFNREQIRGEMVESVEFVKQELQNVGVDLQAIQTDIGDFKRREQVTDLDVEVAELLASVTEFEKDKLLAEADHAEQLARFNELSALLFDRVSVPVSPLEDPAVMGLVERLGQIEAELELASIEYGPDHPRRTLLQKQVDTARGKLAAAIAGTADGNRPIATDEYHSKLRREYTDATVRLSGLEARRRALVGAIDAGRERLSALPPKQFEMRGLKLRESITEDKYRRLLERLEEMELEVEGIQGNATILDLAVKAAPTVPRVMLLLYVAVLSALGAIAAVVTMEYRDNTIKSPDVITNVLQMTNFGMVPKIRDLNRAWLERSSEEHAFEHFRKLRANVRFSSVKKPIRCLMVTSSNAGEGKSSTTASLALALSQMEQRVLLVDTDLRRPNLMRILEMDPNPGVTDVLTGEMKLKDAIKPTGFENLDILTSGPIPPNPAELFESETMDQLVAELRDDSDYDMVIFDSAPTLLTTDTPVLAAKMDGVLVVIESGRTSEEQALMTKEMLVNAGARVIGAVLNKARRGGDQSYYYYTSNDEGGENGTRPPQKNGKGILSSLKEFGEKIGIGD